MIVLCFLPTPHSTTFLSFPCPIARHANFSLYYKKTTQKKELTLLFLGSIILLRMFYKHTNAIALNK
ncbi:hypothetical protein L2E82_51707 [Cichorium intybus]|nr:hypothetical protein L2E82_51707 [Cichorium intybus]